MARKAEITINCWIKKRNKRRQKPRSRQWRGCEGSEERQAWCTQSPKPTSTGFPTRYQFVSGQSSLTGDSHRGALQKKQLGVLPVDQTQHLTLGLQYPATQHHTIFMPRHLRLDGCHEKPKPDLIWFTSHYDVAGQ